MIELLLIGAVIYGRFIIKKKLETGNPKDRESVGQLLWISGWVIAVLPILIVACVAPFVSNALSEGVGIGSILWYTIFSVPIGVFFAFLGRKYKRGESTVFIKEGPVSAERVSFGEGIIAPEGTKLKKRANKVSVWTSIFNFLMTVWIFFVPYSGITDLTKVETTVGWNLVYQTSFPAAIIGFVWFWLIPVALLNRKVQTPENIKAAIPRNRRSLIVSGLFLLWAIYGTAIVATAVEIR